jgi:hypothetical protein
MVLCLIKHREFFLLYLDQWLPNSFSLRLSLYDKKGLTPPKPIKILLRVRVSKDGVWIHEWIY